MHPSPLLAVYREARATLLSWGEAGPDQPGIDTPAALGPPELEYAAIRKHTGLLDEPTRGVLELTGSDRLDFLNRMVTQELKGVTPFQVRRSFWLSRKGRIDADLRVVILPDRVLLDVDALAAARTLTTLSGYIITENCTLRDVTQSTHRLALHGPTAPLLLRTLASAVSGSPAPHELTEGDTASAMIDNTPVTIARDDTLGVPGFELFVPAERALALVQHLIAHAHEPHEDDPDKRLARPRDSLASRVKLSLVGWFAVNIARIEAGTPLYNIDFGAESLPAESGVLHDRVNFKKGCYLGQEIVARMHALGKPKQTLVAIRFEEGAPHPQPGEHEPQLPERGDRVLIPGDDPRSVGLITSATLSPMLGLTPIAFAQVRTVHAAPGTVVQVQRSAGTPLTGTIQPTLRFWPRV